MKRIVIAILTIVCLPLAAQVSTPLSLSQLTDSALQNNQATRSARHDIEAAHEQRREAFTKYFPNVSATAATFNANRGMAKMTLDPQTMMSPELGAVLAQSFPPEALASLATPTSISMMKKYKAVKKNVKANAPISVIMRLVGCALSGNTGGFRIRSTAVDICKLR